MKQGALTPSPSPASGRGERIRDDGLLPLSTVMERGLGGEGFAHRTAVALYSMYRDIRAFVQGVNRRPVATQAALGQDGYVGRRPKFVDLVVAYVIDTTLEQRHANSGKRTHVRRVAA